MDVYSWLVNDMHILREADPINTKKKALSSKWNTRIIEFLKSADISLVGLKAYQKDMFAEVDVSSLPAQTKNLHSELTKSLKAMKLDTNIIQIETVRKNDLSEDVSLNLSYKSTGTKALFNLAGPILNALDNGLTLIVDELNTGLHPLAFQHLIALFCDPEANPHHAQLIFTTHDTSVTGTRLHRAGPDLAGGQRRRPGRAPRAVLGLQNP